MREPTKSREVNLVKNLVASVSILLAALMMLPCLAF